MKLIFTLSVITLFISNQLTGSEKPGDLESLLKKYENSYALHKATPKPVPGEENFTEKLRVWANNLRLAQDEAKKLLPELLQQWILLKDNNPIAKKYQKTISEVIQFLRKGKEHVVPFIWPSLVDKKMTAEKAGALVILLQPDARTRMNDRSALNGLPTESWGWATQAAHSLALLRKGQKEDALKELKALKTKVSINYKKNPDGSLDYGPEAGNHRYRSYLDYIQLCEVIYAYHFALSGNPKKADAQVQKAIKMDGSISSEVKLIIDQIKRTNNKKDSLN